MSEQGQIAQNERLLAAAKSGDLAGVEAALAAGAEVNTRTIFGQTALMRASENGHVEVAALLERYLAGETLAEAGSDLTGTAMAHFNLSDAQWDALTPKAQAALAEAAGVSPSLSDQRGQRFVLTFVRQEEGEAQTTAIVEVLADVRDQDAALECLVDAVTEWVADTADGKAAWDASCEDFNIGDLADEDLGSLTPYLKRHGIADLRFREVQDEVKVIPFDTVLVDRERLSDPVRTGPDLG